MSDPVIAKDRVLVIAADTSGALSLVALNRADGHEVWRYAVSAASVTQGVAPSIATVGDKVFAYKSDPSNPLEAAAVALNINDGTPLWTAPQTWQWLDWLSTCGSDVCASAASSGQSLNLRINPDTGLEQIQTDNGRSLGEGLHDTGARDPDIVTRLNEDGTQLWEQTASALFGGLDRSSDGGWTFGQFDDLIVGSLGPRLEENSTTYDLADAVTAGFDAATGTSRWVEAGAQYDCLQASGEEPVAIRCRERGTVTYDLATGRGDVQDLDVTVEGFDPHTGAATWSVPLGAARSVIGDKDAEMQMRIAGSGQILIPDAAGGAVLLDTATGKTSTPKADTPTWCTHPNTIDTGLDATNSGNTLRVGVTLHSPCVLDGSASEDLPEASASVGAQDGDLFVWAGPDGVHAAHPTRSS